MIDSKYKVFIWSMLVALVLISIPSAIQKAPGLIGKIYTDSDEFKEEMDRFYNRIGPLVLNPIDLEKFEQGLVVTTDEIDEHRTRYGSRGEQINNIHEQYDAQIEEAEETGNSALKKRLTEERDTKLADIEKNFESDEHVEKKIRTEKLAAIKQYVKEFQAREVSDFPVAYELIDIETGENFSNGDISEPAAYKKIFNEEEGYLKAYSIDQTDDYYAHGDFHEYSETATISVDELMNELMHGNLAGVQNSVRKFEGTVLVTKEAMENSYLSENVPGYYKYKYTNYTLWGLAVIALILLFTVLKFKKKWVTDSRFTVYYDRCKIDIKAIILFLTLLFTAEPIYSRAVSVFFHNQYYTGIWTDRFVAFVILTLGIWFITFQLVNSIERWKHKGVFEQDLLNSYAVRFLEAILQVFLNRSIGVQMFILLIGFFLAGVGFASIMIAPFLLIAYIPAVLFLGLPAIYIFVRRSAYMSRIFKATEEMAAGRLNQEIKVEGKSPFAKHAANLNNLREGVQISMNEQAKSERLKTELITNVSHDLRTPLTSIITYTDLLKTEDLSVEDRLKYVDILDKKSQRLKTLIEDLFEVSKMASGNLELNKQRVDLTQLLQQAFAEHEEEISASGLDFRMNIPESELVARVDGQKWWRVLDNLIVNAIKYSMPGTRVYITLQQVNQNAEFVVKNISKYELNEAGEELFERFKRADTSRHTDGSGLGLAIAQSIVDMHAGEMRIDVDGDLFKVTVEIPIV